MTLKIKKQKWREVSGDDCWEGEQTTENNGAVDGPGFRRKWCLKAVTGHSGEPGMRGKGIDKERCWYWIVLEAAIWSVAPCESKTRSARNGTLEEMRLATSGTKLDFRKKVKKATRNRGETEPTWPHEKACLTGIMETPEAEFQRWTDACGWQTRPDRAYGTFTLRNETKRNGMVLCETVTTQCFITPYLEYLEFHWKLKICKDKPAANFLVKSVSKEQHVFTACITRRHLGFRWLERCVWTILVSSV